MVGPAKLKRGRALVSHHLSVPWSGRVLATVPTLRQTAEPNATQSVSKSNPCGDADWSSALRRLQQGGHEVRVEAC